MFYGCSSFNQSVSNFDTSSVTNMQYMFSGCSSFDQSVSNFDTSLVTTMFYMFYNCSSFNQSVSNFDLTLTTTTTNMFNGVTLSTTNYDAFLNAIILQSLNNSLSFHGGNSQYTVAGEDARWQLVAVHDSADADASGTDKSVADDEAAGYQYWHTGESKIYIKKSAASADWTNALDLGFSWTVVDGGLYTP
jgi:surface protein